MDKRLKDMAKKIEGDFVSLLCMKNEGFDDITEGLRSNDSDVIDSIADKYSHKSILSLSDYRRREYAQPTVVDSYIGKMSIMSGYDNGGSIVRVGDVFDLKDIKFAEFNGNVLRIVTDKKEFTLIR